MTELLASRRAVYRVLAALIVLGALARVAIERSDPPLHPDEYFQYLEPAWWHLTGAGVMAWEWFVGARSWVLPFYNGAWMALLSALGVEHGATLGRLLKLHWALVNTSVVWLAWRGGASVTRRLTPDLPRADDARPKGFEGGLLAAALCSGFAILVSYASHTISEMPSMLTLLGGLVLVAERTELPGDDATLSPSSRAALAGCLLSLGACLRIANGPLVLIGPLWLGSTRRYRALIASCAGALLPMLLFAAADRLTWGAWAGSFVEYLRFNVMEGGAANFGVAAWDWYARTIWQRTPFALLPMLLIALFGVRATFPYLLTALCLLATLSMQPHKEERFMIMFWPLLLIAVGGTLGALLARARSDEDGAHTRFSRTPRLLMALLVLALILSDGALHYLGREGWPPRDRIEATVWTGRQPNVTGVLVDNPILTAGGLWFGSRAPMFGYHPKLLDNPIISHVVLRRPSPEERRARMAGFELVHARGNAVVLARPAWKAD